MRLFLRKRIEAEKEAGDNDDSLHGGIVGRLRYSDLAEEGTAGSAYRDCGICRKEMWRFLASMWDVFALSSL